MIIRPGIQVKPVESDALLTDRNFNEVWPHFLVEAITVHAEIERRIAQAQQARKEAGLLPGVSHYSISFTPRRVTMGD